MTDITKTAPEYDIWFQCMVNMLEAYRDPPHPALVPFVDRIVEKDAELVQKGKKADPDLSKAHNTVVLRYLTKKKMSKAAICSALHITSEKFELWTERGVHRLVMLAFGTGPGYMF